MDISATTSPQSAAASEAKASSSALTALSDYQSFLKLFVTQLKYQDPLNPTSQEDFLSQTAQFSTLEQIMALNTKADGLALATRTTAASLIGRMVSGTATDAEGIDTPVEGLVTQVDYGDGGDLILGLLDGSTMPFSSLTSISQA